MLSRSCLAMHLILISWAEPKCFRTLLTWLWKSGSRSLVHCLSTCSFITIEPIKPKFSNSSSSNLRLSYKIIRVGSQHHCFWFRSRAPEAFRLTWPIFGHQKVKPEVYTPQRDRLLLQSNPQTIDLPHTGGLAGWRR